MTLFESLAAGQLPPGEVAQIIGSILGHGHEVEENLIACGPERDAVALKLRYTDDELVDALPGPDLREEHVAAIRSAIETEAAHTTTHIRRVVLFGNAPVRGWWRHEDQLQILPLPENAPRPNYFLADHPFLLEFRVRKAVNVGVRVLRESTSEHRLRLLLNALCFFKIRRLRKTSQWVTHTHTHGREADARPEENVVYAQGFYSFPGYSPYADEFSDTSAIAPITVEPAESHFGRLGLRVGEPLAVPETLSTDLLAFSAVAEGVQDRVLRASYWLAHADEVQPLSRSAAFASLVQAIEALIPARPDPPRCPSCDAPIGGGASRAFREFVEEHVPDLGGGVRRALYRTRSGIVHGSALLRDDEGGLDLFGLSPPLIRTWRLFDDASRACEVSLRNYLRSHG